MRGRRGHVAQVGARGERAAGAGDADGAHLVVGGDRVAPPSSSSSPSAAFQAFSASGRLRRIDGRAAPRRSSSTVSYMAARYRPAAAIAPCAQATTVRRMARPVIGICTPLERARWARLGRSHAFVLAAQLRRRGPARRRARRCCSRPTRRSSPIPTRCSTCSTGSCSPAAPTSTPRPTAREPHPATIGTVPERDAFEIALARARARARPAAAGHLPRACRS